MQRELGGQWTLDDLEQNDCKVCSQVFLNNRLLNEHYCSQHFYAKLSEGLPNQPPYQCPSCAFNSKTHLALVRHVGNKHKVIKKILFEQGYEKLSRNSRFKKRKRNQSPPPPPPHHSRPENLKKSKQKTREIK